MRLSQLTCLALLCASAVAVAETRSVEVHGKATVEVDPDMGFVEGQLYGAGATAAEALEEFEKRKAALTADVTPKAFEGVELTFDGISLSQVPESNNMMGVQVMGMGGSTAPGEAGEFVVGETIRLSVKNLKAADFQKVRELLTRIVDTAAEAEMVFASGAGNTQVQMVLGGGTMNKIARFSHSDFAGAKRAAMQQAVDDARKSADTLATLAEAKLGKVLEIAETPVPDVSLQTLYSTGESTGGSEHSSTGLGKIKVQVQIRVKFELITP